MPHLPRPGTNQHGHLQKTPPHRPLIHPLTRVPENGFDFPLVLLFSTDPVDFFVEVAELGRECGHVGGVLPAGEEG